VIKKIQIDGYKTKKVVEFLSKLPIEDSAIVMINKPDEKLQTSARNIPALKVAKVKNVSILDLLSYKHLILTPESIAEIEKLYA
jgi:large subunit ribosomal protein L4